MPDLTHKPQPRTLGLTDITVGIPSSLRNPKTVKEPRPTALWNTLEFKLYYVACVVVIPLMVWIPVSLSNPSHPNFQMFKSKLSEGWLFGRQIDNSDGQYRHFRNNLPILTYAMIAYTVIKFLRVHAFKVDPYSNIYLIPINLAFSIIMVLALHGTSILKILAILTINYLIARTCKGSKVGPVLTWIFNGGILFLNSTYQGYQFNTINPALAFLDKYQGIDPRWDIRFNITMLKLVSFNMDYYWSFQHVDNPEVDINKLSDKQRTTISHPQDLYSYMNYISYVLYVPLFIAGPIMTFNDFIWQHRRPKDITQVTVIRYIIRFLISWFTMELVLHFMYVVAIKDRKAWMGDSPAQISMIGFWNLIIVWLKLLLPWRFFRLWALLDSIDPPENMVRCMVNNYSPLGFWRSWHRSYNLWITRYIYIPLGGAKHVFLNTLLVFSFVALWHDLTFRLLAWGWLVSLFVIPELAVRYLLPASQYGKKAWYRHACAVGAVLNILLMMIANLVGFVIGTDGIKFFVARLFGTVEGLQFLVFACCCIFVAVQLMFEYREEEMRRGIYHRC
ncbi:MBOAT, membrane-bound O-acyltransferase family-domain-containing protein [Crucibulum laeve]|uniref:MBOAT, membrane-bound O-acyltransferase family-domain-containing protein n=1 Tax=Crucibulum laeve TaxID=68775 RepID=A0A5C3LQI0_9AGAR|nr:MBOAT, membrane-bound O-acyltransferase family-domain-containing protein [Crucibulum laeve]